MESMNLRRIKMNVSVLAVGLALTLAPSAPAWAGVHHIEKSKKHQSHKPKKKHHANTSKGSATGTNKGGSFCQLEAATEKDEESALETAATKAMLANNWPAAQKDLLQIDQETSPLENEFIAALSSAPANVQAAVKEVLKFIPAEEKDIQNATSVSQFESSVEALTASGTPFGNAAKVLAAYQTAQCGSTTTTT
jgi:hypothetical protein